jgi:outer membrane protein TolC
MRRIGDVRFNRRYRATDHQYLADSDTQIATYLVNLYRALGGGWEVADVAFGADGTPRQKIEAR